MSNSDRPFVGRHYDPRRRAMDLMRDGLPLEPAAAKAGGIMSGL